MTDECRHDYTDCDALREQDERTGECVNENCPRYADCTLEIMRGPGFCRKCGLVTHIERKICPSP